MTHRCLVLFAELKPDYVFFSYQLPLPTPFWMIWPESESFFRWSLIVLRLAPVSAPASFTVTLPRLFKTSMIFSDKSGRAAVNLP